MKTTNGEVHHAPSTTLVFQTDDYSRFNMVRGNRGLDNLKIKRILSDIDRGTNLLQYVPILVVDNKGKLDIVDGQHRFMVSRKIKSPVYYVLADNLSLYDIARMNSNTEKWKAKDFINCYMELGNDNYVRLSALLKKYPGLPVTTAISLMQYGRVGSGGSGKGADKFQRGEFVAEHEKVAQTILKKTALFEFDNKFSRPFLAALSKVIDAGLYPIDELIEKVNASPDALRQQDHYKKYLTNLEEIASKGKHKRVAIY